MDMLSILYINRYQGGILRRAGLVFMLVILLTSCKPPSPPISRTPEATKPAEGSPLPETGISSSPTIIPTETPIAVKVDDVVITLAEYQTDLGMFEAAKGTELAPEDKKRVIDELIDQALLAEGASQNGFVVDDAKLNERVNGLIAQLGSEQALTDWINAHQFDQATFTSTLKRSIAAAWMRDQIAASVPSEAEQVHAWQILLYDAGTADEIYQQLQSGNSFRNLALKYDPITGGDLGWFPRGYLPDKNIEEVAFSLDVEDYSSIIETPAGYHIVQVIEKDPQRELSPEALLVLQSQAVRDWLNQRRSETSIEVYIP